VRRLAIALVVVAMTATIARADDDPAWVAYDAAFVALARGDANAAETGLRDVVKRWPDHPAGVAAARRLETWPGAAERAAFPAAPLPDPPPVADPPSNGARGELTLWMTISGAMLARDVCVDRCNSDEDWAASLMLASGSAFGLSLFATRHGVHEGEAQLYDSAMTWGSWNALGLNDGFADTRGEAELSIGLQLGGLGAGLGLWRARRPTSGDVALANTFFFWGTVLTLYGHLAADAAPTWRRVVAAGDLGIFLGALLSTEVKISRGRSTVIDVGGVLGSLVGGLIAVSTDSARGAGIGLGVSTLLGLGIATLATRDWDAPEPPPLRVQPANLGPDAWGGSVSLDF
jgi:hypothetical protein